ncbi:type IV pilus twitching motility protein PilT [Gloeobacter kilaueensis]|uniref:Twitching motility protein n=1 Tax=Gloeobacter kilaueensis (strain ATCC BAA-2537 / CCAP 1431/1 / ULC 316 / JS1) TaxID=1183438 RepID=U5QHH3_GLOK1|nr:type IV pilus twitching motility protein PilT [Gloeobacter kilaueensis]AGY58417.1 twitching motility protein [Gloeobacter kilaueensis JS1]
MPVAIETLMQHVIDSAGSDLHIAAGTPPCIRVGGALHFVGNEPLSPADSEALILPLLSNNQRLQLEQNWELDCSYSHGGTRFRVNVYKDKGNYAAALRALSSRIPTIQELGLPPVMREIADRPRGLVLVTGPTGSGKTTTLASLVDYINGSRSEHILTVEDPIEYLFVPKRSLINQRQLGEDTKSFANALRAALREDPDVILVGEMRDLETIQLAITAAETGHLVFATLHTSSAAQTVDRMVDVFPPAQQQQIRVQLSNSLVAVFSQTLIPRVQAGRGLQSRVMAQEIMVVNPAIANLIREGKTSQIYSALQTGGSLGMKTLESSLRDLVTSGQIALENALTYTSRPEEFQRMLGGAAPRPATSRPY